MITKELIDIAVMAAEKASVCIMEIYNSGIFDTELKGDNSPLTLADKKSHNIIIEELSQTGLPVLSEEGKNIPFKERASWEKFWLIDPLDGTKEFIKRNGEFTVNIALIESGQPVWGVVSAPALGKTYFIDESNIVRMKTNSGETVLNKRNKDFNPELKGIRVVASRSHIDPKTQKFLDELIEPKIVSMGSSLKFMMLAEGLADVYPRFAPTSEWDTAAAHAILNALNYNVFKEDSDFELGYNKESILNPGFICR
jgi:3'(2'), 5'-bisphosphate nucleotidase